MSPTSSCPLCLRITRDSDCLVGDLGTVFRRCAHCQLIFRTEPDYPEAEDEKARYLEHKNSADDRGYVDFLLRPYHFAQKHWDLPGPMLDYGCGYAPVFTQLMRDRGHRCDGYDPFFFPEGIQRETYPTIFCIETAEHFHAARTEWRHLLELMAPGGYLTVTTDFWRDLDEFPQWYYQKDPTHVSFYHLDTLKFIAGEFQRELLHTDGHRLALFYRPN